MDSKGRRRMRLHIARGSLSAAQGEDFPMDAAVWSKMPEDLIWEVLRFVPAAKLFQLQLVSPNWRRVLTSPEFRKRFMAAQAERESEEPAQRVVACVDVEVLLSGFSSSKGHGKVVDIDLSSLVPSSFWATDSYSVVAAADGLVCISNNSELLHQNRLLLHHNRMRPWEQSESWTNQYCVINPLTRTCILLPKVPFRPDAWLPPTSNAVTIYRTGTGRQNDHDWKVATYDLATGGAGRWVLTAHRPPFRLPELGTLTMWGGETYGCGSHTCKVCVLAPANGAGPLKGPSLELEGPSLELEGPREHVKFLVAHRGALFFVAQLQGRSSYHRSTRCGVWRLARDQMEWVAVARLVDPDVERLTGLNYAWFRATNHIFCPYGVREFICCCKVDGYKKVDGSFRRVLILLGFNLDTGEWEVVHAYELQERRYDGSEDAVTSCGEIGPRAVYLDGMAVELRLDLFLC